MKKVKAKETYIENGTTQVYLYANKEYNIYSEFLTEKMFSGKCYVILCEDDEFRGLDSNYFDEI